MAKRHKEQLMVIGLNIAYYRKKSGFTQEALAEKLGISRTHMGHIEAPNMDVAPSLDLLLTIAEELDIPTSKLLEIR